MPSLPSATPRCSEVVIHGARLARASTRRLLPVVDLQGYFTPPGRLVRDR